MHPISIVILAVVALTGCDGASQAAAQEAEPRLSVTLVTVTETDVAHTLTLTGTLAAREESQVAADVQGRVLSTNVERGDIVEAGATLARVDTETASLSAAEARAQLEAARADDAEARLECGRSQALFERRAISEGERDRDQARCEASAWNVRAAEARVSRAVASVTDGTVRAPFRGMIAERFVTAGEYVRPETRVATLVSTDSLRLELAVPEADALAIAVGQTVRFDVAALPGESFEGTVRYVGPAVRRDSRDVTVEALVDNTGGTLRPGMFAVSELDLGLASQVTIPRTAIREDDGTAHVFVARGGRLEERVVRTGPDAGSSIVVLDRLRAGERVVAPIPDEARDGIEIQR